MEPLKKEIDYRFKILYAVAMIMVCCGHTNGGGISILSDWFPYGGVHLSIFVFASGYFYKNSSERHIGKYILKKVKTLLVPLYVYNLAYGIIVQVLRRNGFEMGGEINFTNLVIAPIKNGHQFIYNMGGWFIVPLFMVEVYNILIQKLIHKINTSKEISTTVFFTTSIILGLIGNQLACLNYLSGWWLVLVRMLYFVPFWGLGIFYHQVLEKYDHKVPSIWYFAVIFIIKLIIVYYYGKMPVYTPSWCNNFTEGPIMPIINGFLGIALWMRIATILEPVIGKSKWINVIADNTYSIMMNQFLGFMIVKTLYALLSRIYVGFSDFDWVNYRTNIWWYYTPKGLNYTLIIYVVVGITLSVLFQKVIDQIKSLLLKIGSKKKFFAIY
ncbi:hypothetical protein ACTQ1N_02140 [Porcincola sp. LCP21S3_C12]|uniref:hypothetical protein n=1 Tax=Porcincola sp. LCP21S3_C12 TaxID=3438798 RepID=UPI003F98DDC3